LGWSISITSYTEPERLTDAAGHYTFTNLPAGTYSVRQVVPAGYQVVAPVGGAFTSNLSASDSLTANFGDRLMPATLQGTAYLDANNNGVQDSNEPGQAHVTMYLDANNNGMLDAGEVSTVTDALGRYTFSNLAPSQVYTVREVAPAGSTPTGTPIQSVQVGTNIDLSPQAGSQTETSVAIDPTNTNNIFVVSNTTNGAGLFASSSHDGGLTWSAPQNIANGSDGLTAGSCDGSVSFDSYGNLFFTYIDSSISNIVVAMSADGGRTFTQLTRFTSPIDQPTITTGPNSVWVVYNHSGVPTVSHATVTGKGVGFVSAFSAPMSLSEPAGISGNFGDIAVGPEGQVAVAYQNANSNSGPDRIYLNVSTNGSTFGGYTLATSTNVGAFDRIPVQPTRSVDAEVSLGYDRSNGPHRGRLYMAYTDAPAPGSPDTNIFLRYSDDNGGSWSAPIKVNDDLTTNSQILPKLAVDPSTGNVAVSFYDARDSASNSSVAYYAAISLDGGQTFLLNKRLSAGMSTAPADSFNFGDYSGLAFSGGKLWAAWGDNSNSTGENDGSLDVMVNSAWVSSFDGFELRVSPGQTVSNLDFGNNRTVSPQFVVDDFLYPFSMTGPYWDRVPNASAYRGFEHLHTQGRAQIASNTVQWSL
ncbi:MAG TPA: SdrD B-like domain-containing protein, partial [Isosphaeraceae bacterium]|nr:SdrD B-like domain-containing protein [Isosphaeraceae bacterium]